MTAAERLRALLLEAFFENPFGFILSAGMMITLIGTLWRLHQ